MRNRYDAHVTRFIRYTRDLGQPAIIRKRQNGWQISLRDAGALRVYTRVCRRLHAG